MGRPDWVTLLASLGFDTVGDCKPYGFASVGRTEYQEGDAALLGYLVVHRALLKKLCNFQGNLPLEFCLIQLQFLLQDLLTEISNRGALVGVGLIVGGAQGRRIKLGLQKGLGGIRFICAFEHSLSQLTRGFFVLLRHRNSRLGDFLYQFILLCKIDGIFLDPRGLHNCHQQSQTLHEKFPP